MSTKRALVLSGGSIKGAFQAGAIAELLDSGFVPDAIYGTSVGSLNGSFLTERAGRAVRAGQTPDWAEIGRALEKFWLEDLKSPAQVGTQRRLLPLATALLRSRFAGLIDTGPLRKLLETVLEPDNLRASPVRFYACAVNLANGEAVYASQDYSGILDYIIASTAIPVEMPHVNIGNAPYVDGGVREVAPLGKAIEDEADEIACICCLPRNLEGVAFRPGNLLEFALRLMDVVTNELINNDLDRFEQINDWVRAYQDMLKKLPQTMPDYARGQNVESTISPLFAELPFNKWREIPITLIRPENEVVLDLMHFTPTDIEEVIKQGRNVARKILGPAATSKPAVEAGEHEAESAV